MSELRYAIEKTCRTRPSTAPATEGGRRSLDELPEREERTPRFVMEVRSAMSDATHPTPHRQRPHPGPMAAPFLEFDLGREIQQLQQEHTWSTGRNSRTLVKHLDFRVVLMALKAGTRVREHKADGRISIQTVAGRISIRASERTLVLPAGSLLALDRATIHDVEALEDSAILLTIARPEEIRS